LYYVVAQEEFQMQEKQNLGKFSRRQFLLAAAATGLLAACAPVPAAPGSSGSEAAAPGEEAVTLILNMRAGGDQSEPAIYVQRPAKFMEDNPNITIELGPIPAEEYEPKIIAAASAGTIGDVIWDSDVWALHTRLSKLGVIAPVDEQLEAAGI
jgi:ABC-type glycerol-3-phosphate transport system substrate-binding protein